MAYEAAKTNEVAYMDEVRRLFGGYKRGTFDRLQLRPGHRILDVGCGAGDDVQMIAKLVQPGGEVVGLDRDEEMIKAARVRSVESDQTVRFVLGNAYPLPFESGSFDGCRADRLLQHLDEPEHAIAEFFRVLRTAAWCVVADVDWGTLTVTSSFPALTRQILNCGSDLHRNGWAARGLYGQFRSAGFCDIQCDPIIAHTTEWDIASWAFGLEHYATEAAKRRLVSQDERQAWLGDLLERNSAGTFFSSIMGLTVSGRRP